jgi:hypothetical protein
MKKLLTAVLLSVSLMSVVVVAEAKPARDSHNTKVDRISLVEAKKYWDYFLEPGGEMHRLNKRYGVYGLRYYTENPQTGEMEVIELMTGQRHQVELTRAWDCVEYMSDNEDYDGNVAMYKDRSKNTADVYIPGAAKF